MTNVFPLKMKKKKKKRNIPEQNKYKTKCANTYIN